MAHVGGMVEKLLNVRISAYGTVVTVRNAREIADFHLFSPTRSKSIRLVLKDSFERRDAESPRKEGGEEAKCRPFGENSRIFHSISPFLLGDWASRRSSLS